MTANADLEALGEVDRQNRVARTVVQSGTSGAAVTLIEYPLAYFRLDLDPWSKGTQIHFPTAFTAALFITGAGLMAWWMNRKRPAEVS